MYLYNEFTRDFKGRGGKWTGDQVRESDSLVGFVISFLVQERLFSVGGLGCKNKFSKCKMFINQGLFS